MNPRRLPSLNPAPTSDRGQATIEFALLLPLVIGALLMVVQVLILVLSQISLQHEARIAVRAAAVAADPVAAARRAVADNDPQSTSAVDVETTERLVTVVLTRQVPIAIPVIGQLWPDIDISARLTMALEPPLQPMTLS